VDLSGFHIATAQVWPRWWRRSGSLAKILGGLHDPPSYPYCAGGGLGEGGNLLTTPFNSIALALAVSLRVFGGVPEPEEFLRVRMKLSPSQITEIQNGKAFAKILSSSNASDIFVGGAVYIHAKPAAYIRFMRDVFRGTAAPGYLGGGEFSTPPTVGDLEGLTLNRDDIEDLRNCRPGDCELQLPEESMEAARASIQWGSPKVAEEVTALAKRGIIRLLKQYAQGGDRALGTYRDKQDPLPVADQFARLLSHLELFPQYLPNLNLHLLQYPDYRAEGTQDFFYWEEVNFGLKPTIRVNHGIVYQSPGPGGIQVLAVKQLYATHYFQTALDLSFCVPSSKLSGEDGFYLITVKGSRQAGLTGMKGGLVRKVATTKTRESLQRGLNNIREKLEHQSGSQE
jgi:hypothetical protein